MQVVSCPEPHNFCGFADASFSFDRAHIAPWFAAGDREFKFLKQQMANYGINLEQAACDAHANKGTNKPILSDISDLGNIHDVKSGVLTALDNASRIGTFGMISEGANLFSAMIAAGAA